MAIIQKSSDQLSRELIEQVEELRARCAAFDSGTAWEAKNIASSIYKLVHDGGKRSKSILGLLDLKRQVPFISTARYYQPPRHEQVGPGKFVATSEVRMPPLAGLDGLPDGTWTWAPRLGEAKIKNDLSFSRWWDEAIFTDHEGRDLSRKNVVFSMRSQDGGAHVDDHLRNEAYYWLSTDANPAIRSLAPPGSPSEPARAIPNGHKATIRQIGWELDETLKRLGF